MNKVFPLAISMSLLFTAAVGCSGGSNAPVASVNSEQPKTAAPSKDPINLRFSWWGGQSRHDYTLKMIEMYEKKNPNVKIQPEYAAYDDYWKKLVPQAAANDLPDIMQMSVAYVAQYGDKGQLEDLASYMDKGIIDKSSISDAFLKVGQYNGKQYQVTLGVNALAAIYDPQLFKAAGVNPPSKEWTWADAEAMGTKLKANGKLLSANVDDRNFFNFYLRAMGQNLFGPDGVALAYTDDKLFVDYYKQLQRMYDAGLLMSMDKFAQKKGVPEDDEMVLGNAGISFSWSNLYVAESAVAKRTLEIAPPPGPNIDKGLYLQSSQALSVSKNSKNKEEAAKFVNFMINDIEGQKIMKGERGVPASTKVQDAIKPLLTPEEQKVVDYVAWVGKNTKSDNPIDPVGAVEIVKLLTDLSQQILYKKTTPEEAAAKFRKESNAILVKNKK
ncbi:multiple sugar transport system substrate-binding protein [Paenibacillus sp. 1_12]|uniref:ABC transporter substrate-binding protein n=1 Tax=Paenibacillus sp. 1_12 TaxID=1566278 RepID=UPI0008EF673B|nr:extracellular solute-binding protein [Paenibacillus sp. 1_12]SFK74086.1 multiple sugar transport system substrate-binding protein [Paenibacillus sp. 1_12]